MPVTRCTLFFSLLTFTLPVAAQQVPPPIPPEITELKELHRTTALIRDGRSQVHIVAPASGELDASAEQIQRAIERVTDVLVPIVNGDDPAAAVPVRGHLIALGDRTNNQTISELYDRHFTLLDAKYPGDGGWVVRSVHSPFGDGRNVILVGGAESADVSRATDHLVDVIGQAGGDSGRLNLGWIQEIKLSDGYDLPERVGDVPHWGEAPGFNVRGNFGWNAISRAMALYYMSGEDRYAHEVLRFAFPDKASQDELFEYDNRAFGNYEEPMSRMHHYYQHFTVLYWDLIEESPVFSDQDRLRITRSISKDLLARKGEGVYELTSRDVSVGGRHKQYSALALYVLGRYFQTNYPDLVWEQALRGAAHRFQALYETPWINGTEGENMYFYGSYIAPSAVYMLLSGDRKPMEIGHYPDQLRAHEYIINGEEPGWPLYYTSLVHLNRAAYLTSDGRWLHYRDRLGLDTDQFRVGQAFWPPDELRPQMPDELVGRWAINQMPDRFWDHNPQTVPRNQAFLWASYRSHPEGKGDFILLDGHDGQSRSPYHNFAIIELRIDGRTILQGRSQTQGHYNQIVVRSDGLVGPDVPMESALVHTVAVGNIATATAEVRDPGIAQIRRTLVQRIGDFAVVSDRVEFDKRSENHEVQTLWHGLNLGWDEQAGAIDVEATDQSGQAASARIYPCEELDVRIEGDVAKTFWFGPRNAGERRTSFALISPSSTPLDCLRLDEHTAVLRLPQPALAVSGEAEGGRGELMILSGDGLVGRAVTRSGLETPLFESGKPVDVDWDFSAGRLSVVGRAGTRVMLQTRSGARTVSLDDGKTTLQDVYPDEVQLAAVAEGLEQRWTVAQARREAAGKLPKERRDGELAPSTSARLAPHWITDGFDESIVDIAMSRGERPQIFVATQSSVYFLRPDGGKNRRVVIEAGEGAGTPDNPNRIRPDGTELLRGDAGGVIRTIHWWPEASEEGGPPLLLIGTRDEQVVALDAEGERQWSFTSEMHPELVKTGQRQWFKESRPGIYGIYSGPFADDRQQAFIGSTSTLEILNPDGSLAERLPTFWGPGKVMRLIDSPDDGRDLLIARDQSGNMDLTVLNNRTLESDKKFSAVPEGHKLISAWARLGREHIFYDDMDGDGEMEIISEINGTWNRVSIWNLSGKPLYNVNLGPGRATPYPNIRDIDVADLDGDGTKEVVVGTDDGYLIALDHQLNRLWSRRLASAPAVLATYLGPDGDQRIFVGRLDGRVLTLDAAGQILSEGQVSGRPVLIAHVGGEGLGILMGTEDGTLVRY